MQSEDESISEKNSLLSRRSAILAAGCVLLAGGAAVAGYEAYWWTPDLDTVPLTVREAHEKALRGELFLVDIRRPEEWRETGIGESAYPLDMRRDDFVQALERLRKSRGDLPVALICARGVRSARTARRLEDAGMSDVHNVPEGMLGSSAGPGWLQSGLPTGDYREDVD